MRKANLGKYFEQKIESANRQYRIQGIAAIEKQEIQTKFINGQMIYTKKGPPDFMGVLDGGKAVIFEAKSTRGKSLPLKNLDSRLHQFQFLKEAEQMGAIAFYLVEFYDLGRYFIVPVSHVSKSLKQAKQGGRKSIPLSACSVEVYPSFDSALDYLAPILKQGSGLHDNPNNEMV